MSATILVLIGLSLGTYGLKSAGPLVLGGRSLPPVLDHVAARLPGALLAALVVVSTVADGRGLIFDARVVGVVVAGIALRLRVPFVLVVLAAVAATAGTRAF
ncbi:MAG: AzlD domain-containing protein [Acidimicrobiales bacterium]